MQVKTSNYNHWNDAIFIFINKRYLKTKRTAGTHRFLWIPLSYQWTITFKHTTKLFARISSVHHLNSSSSSPNIDMHFGDVTWSPCSLNTAVIRMCVNQFMKTNIKEASPIDWNSPVTGEPATQKNFHLMTSLWITSKWVWYLTRLVVHLNSYYNILITFYKHLCVMTINITHVVETLKKTHAS